MTATTYIYFAHNKRKVPLYNSEEYSIVLDNGAVHKISPAQERLMVCYLNHAPDPEAAKRYINLWLNVAYSDFDDYLRDSFIEKFVEQHPSEIVESAETPLQAVNGAYSFLIPPQNQLITLTAEQEKELVEIINQDKNKAKNAVTGWFLKYYNDKGRNTLASHDKIQVIAVEFINNRGYATPQGSSIEDTADGIALILKALIYAFGAIVLIGIFISLFSLFFL